MGKVSTDEDEKVDPEGAPAPVGVARHHHRRVGPAPGHQHRWEGGARVSDGKWGL